MKDVLTIWKGPNWKSFLIGLFNGKANFKVVAYIYNHESFNAKANFKVVVSIYNHESFNAKANFKVVVSIYNHESFNAKANFKVVVSIHESFKSLLTIVTKLTFTTKIWFEFRQHTAQQVEVSSLLMTLLNIPILMFVYLFPCKIRTNVCLSILGNKKLLTLVES